ncbi:xin actin-binding repeat-containing protein 2 [Leucoraja erinacea]|uniref:xin actin-binding repeat-containing protein 2 n=1 Tax=Leucoraja erinaceus TaxID=7782 RepID=UPI0024557472|nr:xin actin-binding repeat-containing protein 2 [Leucoraja erinacea]
MESDLDTRMTFSETQRNNILVSHINTQETESAYTEVVKEDFQAARRIERFSIPLGDLKMLFEKTGTPTNSMKELRGGSSPFPPSKQLPGIHSNCAVSEDLEKTMEAGKSKAAATYGEPGQDDNQESVSLKERLAMYQAAVSKKESSCSMATDPEEEARALPGGLASVKKQFESHGTVSSHRHYQQRSMQDVTSTNEITMTHNSRNMEQGDGTLQAHEQHVSYQTEMLSVAEQNIQQSSVVESFENHITVDGMSEEERPTISARMLKQQFEKSAQPTQLATNTSKQIKAEQKFQGMDWQHVASTSNVSAAALAAGKVTEVTTLREIDSGGASVSVTPSNRGSLEELPPPPPDLLHTPPEVSLSQSPDPFSRKQVIPKDLYTKQRNLYELKRLYKHINPDMRRNLEKEFIQEISAIVTDETRDSDMVGDVQYARYVFEHTGLSPQKCVSPEREYLEWDEILKGEVQSMRWMFETQPLDSIKDESLDESNGKWISQSEMVAGGDVKYRTWMFETQPIDMLGVSPPESAESAGKIPELARGDVRTATWLFETHPLDSMNKMYRESEETTEVSDTRDITAGDVKTARYLFETQSLDTLGHLDSVDETNFLQLKTEIEEIKGNVKKTSKLFETQPLYVIRDQSGQVLEIQTVKREEIEKADVRTARWLFETKPLDMINKDVSSVKVVCGISREEVDQGGVSRAKWLFETHPLDSINEGMETDVTAKHKEVIVGADVSKQCRMFETQPFDSLKDNDNARPVETEEIIGGDVRSTTFLFETVAMDALKDSTDVGKLRGTVTSEEEKGNVRHQTWVFETQPLEMIGEEKEKCTKVIHLEEITKGDVSSYRQVFETMNLSHVDESKKLHIDCVTSGTVQSNKMLFETTPLYAIQDSAGHYHEVKTVRREEMVSGDVRTCRWMFETTPIDQFDESIQKCQIIKGISKEEVRSGDVKTAQWLFETQPLDAIKYLSEVEGEESVTKVLDDIKGDVQTCRWLFETQSMDALYEKVDVKNEVDEIQKGDVKTCTWLFETQPLDAIKDNSEATIKVRTVQREEVQGSDVRSARFLFETESLANIQGEKREAFRQITEIDIQSGDVSRKKWIFENKSLDLINSSSEDTLKKIRSSTAEDIQKGNVINCTWLFENHPIDAIRERSEESGSLHTVTDVQGGNVGKGRFIFETTSLDQIKEESTETTDVKKFSLEEEERGDVKNYTMLFETQPLYAIKDKEGYYHEVTTVRKEVVSGDVQGTRWLFETKPLDLIREDHEVYVIKAVTQEEIQKGDVSSARWRFETQPLDKIADGEKIIPRTICDVQGGDVRSGTQLFESDLHQQYVRTVSVSEIQHGNVRTATWLFETRTMDEIRGEGSECKKIETVGREDVQTGEVKQAIWLFEKQPLDSIQEVSESITKILPEDIPRADVKTTTWLFETTPLHQFNENPVERPEIMGINVEETLKSLYDCKILHSQGILIEANEVGNVKMAKYQLLNQSSPEIEREQVVRGDLQDIMLRLLSKKESSVKAITVDHNEKGNIHLTSTQLLNRTTDISVNKEEIIGCNIQQIIGNLLNHDSSAQKGILIQESEKGDIRMTVYSLLNRAEHMKVEQGEVIKGDVKEAINKLTTTSESSGFAQKFKVNDTERGNVQFYTMCIESGALDYLKLLQQEIDETAEVDQEPREIIQGNVEATKQMLQVQQTQTDRMVAESDILSGNVQSAILSFTPERQNISVNVEKEEIIPGNLKAALDSLNQAIKQPALVEKEPVVHGNLSATLKSLEEAKCQKKYLEKIEVIPGEVKGSEGSIKKASMCGVGEDEGDVVYKDFQNASTHLEETRTTMRGDFQATTTKTLEAASETRALPHQVSNKGITKAMIQNLPDLPQQLIQLNAGTTASSQSTTAGQWEGQAQVYVAKHVEREEGPQVHVKSHLAAQEQSKKSFTQHINTRTQMKQNVKQSMRTKQANVKVDNSVKSCTAKKSQTVLSSERSSQCDVVKKDRKNSDMHTITNLSEQIGAQSVQVPRIKSTVDHKGLFGSIDGQTAKQRVSISAEGPRTFQSPRISEVLHMSNPEIGAGSVVGEVMRSQTNHSVNVIQQTVQSSHQIIQNLASQPITDGDVKVKHDIKNIQDLHTSEILGQGVNRGLVTMVKSGTTLLGQSRMSTSGVESEIEKTRRVGASKVIKGEKALVDIQFSAPQYSKPSLPPPPPPPPAEDEMFPLPPPPVVQTKSEMYETELPPSTLPPPPPPLVVPATTLGQEMFLTGHLPPSPNPQSLSQQRRLVDKAPKVEATSGMPQLAYLKPLGQLEKKAAPVPRSSAIITEESILSMLDTQQQNQDSTRVTYIQHSPSPRSLQSPDLQRAERPVQKSSQPKDARSPSGTKRAFVPADTPHITDPIKPQYVRKFKTPLMIAEEKYRKEREEMEKCKDVTTSWSVAKEKVGREESTLSPRGGCGERPALMQSALPDKASAEDALVKSTPVQVMESVNVPLAKTQVPHPKAGRPVAEGQPVQREPMGPNPERHPPHPKPGGPISGGHLLHSKPGGPIGEGHHIHREPKRSTPESHALHPKLGGATAEVHHVHREPRRSTLEKHLIGPEPRGATPERQVPHPTPRGHVPGPKPVRPTAEHPIRPQPREPTPERRVPHLTPGGPIADGNSVHPKLTELPAVDKMSTQTVTSISSSQSTVLSASEQLHRILNNSADVRVDKETMSNALKDSVKDIGLENISHKEVHEMTQVQSGNLKSQSISPPKFKVKTVQLPKGVQKMQEKREHALPYKVEKKQFSKAEETKTQEKVAIKEQLQPKQSDLVGVGQQEWLQFTMEDECSHLVTEDRDRNIGRAGSLQVFSANTRQDHVKQQQNQQSYPAHLNETQKVQQKKVGEAMYEKVESEQMQRRHEKTREGAFPKVHGYLDQQKGGPTGHAAYPLPLGDQAPTQKRLDWKEENRVKTKSQTFQSKKEQVSYAMNEGSRHGPVVPVHREDLKQEDKGSRETTGQEKELDKEAAKYYIEISDSYRKREELQNILFRLIQFERENDNIDLNAMNAFLEKVPSWLADDCEFTAKESNLQDMKRELTQIKKKALLKLGNFDESIQRALITISGLKLEHEMLRSASPSQKISKISIGSCKLDRQGKDSVEQQACESKLGQVSGSREAEQRSQSPAKRMPSPSPSYITIESTARRTESPLRAAPSPPLCRKGHDTPSPVHRDAAQTPPSPMSAARAHTSSSSSPSPTRGRRYDQLVKLKDTTAKLSHGLQQSAQSTLVHIQERRSEIIPSPATLRRQLKIDTPLAEMLPAADSPETSVTVKDITEMFEEARRSEENKVYQRKDPIDIPERLGSDTDPESTACREQVQKPSVDISQRGHKFDLPGQPNYFEKEQLAFIETLGCESRDEFFGKVNELGEIPTFDVKSLHPVSESPGEISIPIKLEDSSRDKKPLKKSQRSHKVRDEVKKSAQSMLYPETINTQFSHMEAFEAATMGSRTSVQHNPGMFPGINSRHAPPTYEDVVSGQLLDLSTDKTPEELLKNFQETWQESERVFRSHGYKISGTNETLWQEDVLQEHMALSENTGSYQGDLHGLPKDSVSHGMPDRRQTNLS